MQRGVIVVQMRRGSQAHRLGVQPHDVILVVNDHKIDLVEDLERAINSNVDNWKIAIKRGDRTLTMFIKG